MRNVVWCWLIVAGCWYADVPKPPEDMIPISSTTLRGTQSAPFWIDRGVVSARAYDACIEDDACTGESESDRWPLLARSVWLL